MIQENSWNQTFKLVNGNGNCAIFTILSDEDLIFFIRNLENLSTTNEYKVCRWFIMVKNLTMHQLSFRIDTMVTLVLRIETGFEVFDW